jgi:hypothetical protein
MLTNSPSTVGEQDWALCNDDHTSVVLVLCERRGLSEEFGNPRLVGKAWQGYVDYWVIGHIKKGIGFTG